MLPKKLSLGVMQRVESKRHGWEVDVCLSRQSDENCSLCHLRVDVHLACSTSGRIRNCGNPLRYLTSHISEFNERTKNLRTIENFSMCF